MNKKEVLVKARARKRMNKKEVLVKARALIADPKHWTQAAEGRNAVGSQVSVHSSGAERFCSMGAVRKVCAGDGELFNDTLNFMRAVWHCPVTMLNDKGEHTDVLAAFDKAIAEADKCIG